MSSGGVPSNGGGTGGAGGTDAGPTAPWSGLPEGQIWTVGDKPWYETAVPDGPAKELFRAKKYANPSVVATSYAELERVNASRDDSKMVRIPDENAKPEDWNAVYEKLGRPKDPSGYKDVKWGDKADPQMVEFGQNLAFKLGLSPKAVEGVMVEPPYGEPAMPPLLDALAALDADLFTVVEQDLYPVEPHIPLPIQARAAGYMRSCGLGPVRRWPY